MSGSELLADVLNAWSHALREPHNVAAIVVAAVAAGFIIASTFVKTILPLRWFAVGSSAGFIVYGVLGASPLVLALHSILLPINLYRAFEMRRLVRRVNAAAQTSDVSGVWLRPYMQSRRYKAGDTLFAIGDPVDRLYYLTEGRIELVERRLTLEPGQVFGEIAFFAPDRRRTGTARCATACTILSIDEATFRQVYYQNPEFGFEVVRMIVGRLSSEDQRFESNLQRSPDASRSAMAAALE